MLKPKYLLNPTYLKSKSLFAYHMLNCDKVTNLNNYKVEALHLSNLNSNIANLEELEIIINNYVNPTFAINDLPEQSNIIILDRIVKSDCLRL